MKKFLNSPSFFLLLTLYAFWLLLAPDRLLTQLIVGLFVSILVVLFNQSLFFTSSELTKLTGNKIRRWVSFIFILLYEIIKANIEVAKIVLHPKLPISPMFVTIENPCKKDFFRTLYGNVITLTPGTLTVDLTEDHLLIHSLITTSSQALEESILKQQVVQLEEAGK